MKLDYVLDRLTEASTWRGIIAFLTGAGVTISPEQSEVIISLGLAIIGALGFLTKDKPKQ